MARPDESKYHPRRRSDEHYVRSGRTGETAWRAKTGPAQQVAPVEPCRDCGHHPGDHRGYRGQDGARCTLDSTCSGYRDFDGPVVGQQALWD